MIVCTCFVFFCKQKTAYELRISDWSSDVCSSDLLAIALGLELRALDVAFGNRLHHAPLAGLPGGDCIGGREHRIVRVGRRFGVIERGDRKSTRLNSSH